MFASTIDQLSVALHGLSQRFAESGSRLGYFSALYAVMTDRVADGIVTGRFQDRMRMQRLACHFAARYLAALERYEAGEPTPESWTVAFEAAPGWRPIILQHLLLGMNAHINFDLGIAAAEVADGSTLADVERDFNEINLVLADLLGEMQSRLARVSPWMGILDAIGGRTDEAVVDFSMRHARNSAWTMATSLALITPGDDRAQPQARLDARTARLGRHVLHPGPLKEAACLPIRLRQTATPAEVIEALTKRPRRR